MATPRSLKRAISPPPVRKRLISSVCKSETNAADVYVDALKPTLAAIEAGEAKIRDHLTYFSTHLERAARPGVSKVPRMNIADFQNVYSRNQVANGRHFVVHQHDHPVSGVHYDLRLQFSESSAISFAIPYGLPGNPNSIRPNRMAIETRVHNLWNNLIESASHATGSLLIWDTGEYEVLPRHTQSKRTLDTDDENSTGSSNDEEVTEAAAAAASSDSAKLFQAFQDRHIRLRLHGTRLPANYTISLRLPSSNNTTKQPKAPTRKRRRKASNLKSRVASPIFSDSDEPNEANNTSTSTTPTSQLDFNNNDNSKDSDAAIASDAEDQYQDQDATIRATNAYPGATNSINSIHQRHWFLTLDRASSGFIKARHGPQKGRWVRGGDGETATESKGKAGFETFFVRGREVERSVVTGRLARDVMDDEGVEMFVGRKMWRAITE